MMIRQLVALVAVLFLAGCASGNQRPQQQKVAPPSDVVFEVQPDNQAATGQPEPAVGQDFGTNSGGTYPYGSASGSASGDDAGANQEFGNAVQSDLDPALWGETTDDGGDRLATIDSCYRYARAQTRHDQRILADQDAAYGSGTRYDSDLRAEAFGVTFGQRRREKRLIQDCLDAQGYETGN